jgi:hypothetical protein
VARIVACPHCGAPHRTVGAQTEITCDYCRSLVIVARDLTVEELVVPAAADRQLAYEAAAAWLQNEGVQVQRIVPGEARFCPLWVVSGQSGEEHHLPARDDAPALLHSLRLPAMPLVTRGQARAKGLEPLPEATISRADAEAAALATFRDAAPAVETVRLLWLPLVELTAFTAAGPVPGVYVAGAERLLFAPFPVGATDPPVDRSRLTLYGSFVAASWLAGVVTASPWVRGWVEAALGGTLLLWLVAMERRRGGSR